MFASSRPTAHRFTRQLCIAVIACSAVSGFSAASVLAAKPAKSKPPTPPPTPVSSSPPPASQVAATCEGQTFSRVFQAFSDSSYYTLVPGGAFNSPSEGWGLYNGAQIIETTRPDGSTGGVLDMPSGAVAVSPPTCVTLQYPTARVWVQDVQGNEGVDVAIAYPGTRLTVTSPQNVGQVHGQLTSWTLSNPINVQPEIAGAAESVREARFVFVAGGQSSDSRLSGLYVDPRMR